MQQAIREVFLILQSAWRFRTLAVLVAWAVAIAGLLIVALQKDIYEATARVYVNTASQLRVLLGDQIIESDVEEQLRFVRETLMGQAQMERVAIEAGLVDENAPPEQMAGVVAGLSQGITLVSSSETTPRRPWDRQRADDTYLIQYMHQDQSTAAQVVDTLLQIFVQDTIGAKQSSSRAAGDFLGKQIEDYKTRLQDAEGALAAFNRKNFNRLPSLQGGYFQGLQTAQTRLGETEQAIEVAESRLVAIERQMRGEAPRLRTASDIDPNSIEGRLVTAEQNLDALRLRFTEQHPSVQAAKGAVDSLRRQVKELYSGAVDLDGASNNPVFQALQITRNEIKTEIATLRVDQTQRTRRVDELEGLIEEMPEVEAELARLNRDYDVIRDHYQSLLDSYEKENLSREVVENEEMEFRVIDPPSVSAEPVAPNRVLLLLLVLAGSIGAGGLVAYVKSQIDPVFFDLAALRETFDLPTLGAISVLENGNTSRIDALSGNMLVIGFSLALIAGLIGLIALELAGFSPAALF